MDYVLLDRGTLGFKFLVALNNLLCFIEDISWSFSLDTKLGKPCFEQGHTFVYQQLNLFLKLCSLVFQLLVMLPLFLNLFLDSLSVIRALKLSNSRHHLIPIEIQ